MPPERWKSVNIREELYNLLRERARKNYRSISKELEYILLHYLGGKVGRSG